MKSRASQRPKWWIFVPCSNSSWKTLVGAEILQEKHTVISVLRQMEMAPSLSSQRAGKTLPSCPRPLVPLLVPGAAWPSNHAVGLDSFLQQELCLISASWRTSCIGLLTSVRDSNKPSAHSGHIHDRSPIGALASSSIHLDSSHWCSRFLIQAGVVILCVPHTTMTKRRDTTSPPEAGLHCQEMMGGRGQPGNKCFECSSKSASNLL